eukprot:Unigene12692_Nuclearia_a/m.38541 Unigene12692_Nuclearia_a/g.38541  ORF Unigene12692_Nuclearia_a/g.38541 Unigene12692_Nuclearia_a/m.38541 type:complete len:357 (-) Unigene12692_Nuclearia_a:247-1317(-)
MHGQERRQDHVRYVPDDRARRQRLQLQPVPRRAARRALRLRQQHRLARVLGVPARAGRRGHRLWAAPLAAAGQVPGSLAYRAWLCRVHVGDGARADRAVQHGARLDRHGCRRLDLQDARLAAAQEPGWRRRAVPHTRRRARQPDRRVHVPDRHGRQPDREREGARDLWHRLWLLAVAAGLVGAGAHGVCAAACDDALRLARDDRHQDRARERAARAAEPRPDDAPRVAAGSDAGRVPAAVGDVVCDPHRLDARRAAGRHCAAADGDALVGRHARQQGRVGHYYLARRAHCDGRPADGARPGRVVWPGRERQPGAPGADRGVHRDRDGLLLHDVHLLLAHGPYRRDGRAVPAGREDA